MAARNKSLWLISLCLLAITLWIAAGWKRQAGVTDFAAYWTASRQLLARQNPYEAAPVLAMERQLGFTEPLPLIMRNPPWALPFVLPLGLLSYSTAQRLWLLMGLTAALVSIQLLWRTYRNPEQPIWQAWAVAGLFLPLATVLALGQIGPFILLGLTTFLICQERKQDVWAGASGLLIALKPHLVFLFWPALLLWTVRKGRWRVLWGLAAALGGASAIALACDSSAFSQYQGLWRQTSVLWEETPTLGGALCLLISREQHWLAFVPTVAALIWFGFHCAWAGRDWRWRELLPLLLLVSVASTPYAWFFDQVVLLPAVLQATARVSTAPGRKWMLPAILYLGANTLALGLILAHRTTFWYAWTAPAWLLLYLFTMRRQSQSA